ncbi:hypothetical protein Leryth_015003 [Lithospermum erythrorhizon]|nr:hypothetical protein Leryth_015003 [Lithospermum erythrorhizon]
MQESQGNHTNRFSKPKTHPFLKYIETALLIVSVSKHLSEKISIFLNGSNPIINVEHFGHACIIEATTILPVSNSSSMSSSEVHKVCLPPYKTTIQKLRHGLSEIFFPDDPFHGFKNQTWFKKLVLGLQFFFPIFLWAPNYSVKLLRSDIISGYKLCKTCKFASYNSSFVPPLIYSVLGSSRHLAVGPVSIASRFLSWAMLKVRWFSPIDQSILYLQLAFTATFFAGVFQASLGFRNSCGVHGWCSCDCVIATKLSGFLGIVHFTLGMQIKSAFWSWQTIVMGVGFLIFLLTTRQISLKKAKLFWISAAAPLASVILSTILVVLMKSKVHGIKTIGHLPKGLNPPSSNMLYFDGPHLALALKTGLITGILSLTEGVAVGRTFAALKNYQVDGNKEMMAIGLMNMAGSCSSCYVTTAIIITAVVGLIDYQAAIRLWKVDKLDFLACLCSFLSYLSSVPRSGYCNDFGEMFWWYSDCQSLKYYYKEAQRVPSFLILAVEAPIYFANSNYIQERVLRWIREEEERIKSNKENELRHVILDLTAVTAVDTSGLDSISELKKLLEKRSMQLVLANPVGSVMEKLNHANMLESFGPKGLYLTIGEAVSDISFTWKAQP